jgi:uncharacterized membrane protein
MEKKSLIVLIFLTLILLSNQIKAFDFCENGTVGADKIEINDVSDNEKDNTAQWKWHAQDNIEIEVKVANNEDTEKDYVVELTFTDEDGEEIELTGEYLKQDVTIDSEDKETVTFEFELNEDLAAGEYKLQIKAYEDNRETKICVEQTKTIDIVVIEVCDERINESKLEITSITDKNLDNSVDWEWKPQDDIKLEINVENKDYDEESYILELILVNADDEQEYPTETRIKKEITLEEDEEEKVTIEFQIKSNIEEGNYWFYVKVYQEDDEDICTSLRAEKTSNVKKIKIEKSDHSIKITKAQGPTNLTIGDEITYIVTVANLGNKDEPKVKVMLYNYLLGVNVAKEIEDLKSGEEENVTLSFTLSENASDTTKKITFQTEYDYDETKDYYQSTSQDSEDLIFYINLPSNPQSNVIRENKTNTTEVIKNTTNITNKTPVTISNKTAIKSSSYKIIYYILILIVLIIIAVVVIAIFQHKKKRQQISSGTYGMRFE